MINIKGLQGISLIDYPDKICSTVFLAGCNFRCPFCHNKELIEIDNISDNMELYRLIKIIRKRKEFIEGVCITGGEPLLNDSIFELINAIRERLKLPVKIDTNGYNPELLLKIINEKKVDFIAMDIKTSFDKYKIAAGINVDINKIEKSINIIMNSDVDYEFRTTVVPDIVDSNDIRQIGSYIVGARKYVLQQFRNINTYNNGYQEKFPYKPEELIKFKDISKQFIENVEIRGI